MLDREMYRFYEMQAKSSLESFRRWTPHSVDKWQLHGFPARLDSLFHLRALINSMHDNRFQSFMGELGGLDNHERALIGDILKNIICFQETHFGSIEAILPYDTLFAYFAIYKKIISLNSDVETILEIGPGSGLFSFFASKMNSLKMYCQIEVAESYYLLQHYINSYLFRERFDQRCFSSVESGMFYPKWGNVLKGISQPRGFYSQAKTGKCCSQYPWWKIGKMVKETGVFDVITSNANLCEMEQEALNDYLFLVNMKLHPKGFFFVQCFGNKSFIQMEEVLDKLYTARLAPLFIGKEVQGRKLPLMNAVFVNDKNPEFSECYAKENYREGFCFNENLWRDIYSGDSRKNKRLYSEKELTRSVGCGVVELGCLNRRVALLFDESAQCPLWRLEELKSKRIAVWGAHKLCVDKIRAYLHKLHIRAFIDNDTKLHGKSIEGIPVVSFDDIEEHYPVDVCIIAASSLDSIVDQVQMTPFGDNIELFVV